MRYEVEIDLTMFVEVDVDNLAHEGIMNNAVWSLSDKELALFLMEKGHENLEVANYWPLPK
jgi:hypothetical protein